MSKKEEIDIEEEVERLSRKSNIDIRKSEYSFEKRIKNLDLEMDTILNDKLKLFDENKELTEEYLTADYKNDTIARYRERLKKM